MMNSKKIGKCMKELKQAVEEDGGTLVCSVISKDDEFFNVVHGKKTLVLANYSTCLTSLLNRLSKEEGDMYLETIYMAVKAQREGRLGELALERLESLLNRVKEERSDLN